MLKISFVELASRSVVLRLEGQVAGPWVEELRTSCERFLTEGRQVTLDLTYVSFVDHNGIVLFRALAGHWVGLTNCSPFVVELLKEEPL
jgi:anti-anti-sigma regulatory factor